MFKPQQIGGFCEVDSNTLTEDGKYRMELSSWYEEVSCYYRLIPSTVLVNSSLVFSPDSLRYQDSTYLNDYAVYIEVVKGRWVLIYRGIFATRL